MKMFVNLKVISATILCFIIAITLCACKKPAPSSSETNGTSQTSSLTSSLTSSIDEQDEQIESSSESAVTSTSSTVTNNESSSKSSKPSSDTTNKTPTSSKPTNTTHTTTTPSTTTPTTPPKTSAQIIVGKWRGSVDMAPIFSEQGYSVEGTQMVSCDIEFTSGGVIYETIDRVSLKTVYTNLLTQVLNDTLTQNNLTKEQFESSIGKTYDEYLNELVQTSIELIPQTITSAYKFVGEDLYVREQNDADFEKEEYSFSGENQLTVVESGVSVTYTRIS